MSERRPKADVIEKLRAILKKTEERGATPAEAETAFRMASRLMAEHNIEMAELDGTEGPDDISWLEDDVADFGKWSLAQNLAYGICREFFFVEGYTTWKHVPVGKPTEFQGKTYRETKARKFLRFFGTAANVEAAKFTFTALLDAFDRLFVEYRAKTGCPAAERRLFISGVAKGFREKMKEEREATEIERDVVQGRASGSTALVLVSVAERTKAAYKEAHPKMGKSRTVIAEPTGSRSSLEAGYRAGRSLSLRRAVGSSQKGLPGHGDS